MRRIICNLCKAHNQECIFAGPPRLAVREIEQGNEALGSPPKAISVVGVLKCHACRLENQKVGTSAICERFGGRLTNSYSVLPLNAPGRGREDGCRNVIDAPS
jgi:hypothetical protein